MTANHFLSSINNELADTRNGTFKSNLASLRNLVLVIFTEDKTVVPKESAWFGAEVVIGEGKLADSPQSPQSLSNTQKVVLPMRMQPIYLENWIGLRNLDLRRAIIFEKCEGEHMQLGHCWEPIVKKFAGGIH